MSFFWFSDFRFWCLEELSELFDTLLAKTLKGLSFFFLNYLTMKMSPEKGLYFSIEYLNFIQILREKISFYMTKEKYEKLFPMKVDPSFIIQKKHFHKLLGVGNFFSILWFERIFWNFFSKLFSIFFTTGKFWVRKYKEFDCSNKIRKDGQNLVTMKIREKYGQFWSPKK